MEAATRPRAVLALDVGTSSCRASLYDLQGEYIRGSAARVQYAPRTDPNGGAEIPVDWLLAQVCAVIDSALQHSHSREILAIASSVFWHSLLVLDADGQPLTPVYLWADARSRNDANALHGECDAEAIHGRTGCALHWSYWPAKLRWIRRTEPDVWRNAAQFVTFGEYLGRRLSGNTSVSVSQASGTGLFDQHTLAWDPDLLAVTGVRTAQLAAIRPVSAGPAVPVAEFAARWPALAGKPWLAAIGDGAASSLGAGCTDARHITLMIGTSGAERVLWETDRFTIPAGVFCYRLDERRLVVGGALNDGGSLISWLRAAFHLPGVRATEARMAAMMPDAHGLTILPFWGGERSPGWAPDADGSILGLRLSSHPTEILRAAMESVAYRFRLLDCEIRRSTAADSSIVATGAALLHSATWMQILADTLERPVAASAEQEGSSRGAALFCLESLGLRGRQLSTPPRVTTTYLPIAANSATYRAAAERQQRLYSSITSAVPPAPVAP